MEYLVLKWIHIVSSTVLFGTGIGLAFFYFAAHKAKNLAAIKFATQMVVLGDLIFTTPSGFVQLISGALLISQAGWTFDATWLWVALVLFAFAGACWLPVVWIQVKMRKIAHDATDLSQLPAGYWRYFRQWVLLGSLAFPALLGVFWLMIAKPSF
ncbi:DUF2269 domain-containing protein [uncultured Roseobacter sp.]|uniref:DUF2269 family protein n=1 Tax=uncultured Roseobacter sp. TaxID=114847 RepID=UPI0026373173|nr:DUF2269 domain-containing protein [uncultured Roseobacter sp.]